jgi:flagellar hook-length control protein FliK
MAQMLNRVGQSEMRIGMNTSAFGSIEVRTTVHASEVGLTIGSEKGDLRSLLNNEMPGIANTLQQQNLRLNSVSYVQGFGSANQGAGGGNPQQQPFAPKSPYPGEASTEAGAGTSLEELLAAEACSPAMGLSILA